MIGDTRWVILCCSLALAATWAQELDEDSVRLSDHVIPEHYRLWLATHIPNFNVIRGDVDIRVKCVKPGFRNITLHADSRYMSIAKIEIITNEESSKPNKVQFSHPWDKPGYLVINFGFELMLNKTYVIKIAFKSHLHTELHGFYLNSYTDSITGETKQMAVTQFEPTHARTAFPCFDEPALKATFEVSLGHTRSMTSLSNMPIKKDMKGVALDKSPSKPDDKIIWDHYEVSVPMSTYLVAFVISEFDHRLAESTKNNVTFRIWARPDAIDQTNYAADIGPKILQFFEDFFNVPYPLPKMDMIAIPDFQSGAMENWGLVTYRETALLYKSGVSNIYNKKRIASVIAHELGHQWFGNLVSPSWWTDLWLNEGFASYVEYLGVDAVHPEWETLNRDFVSDLHSVMEMDSLGSSHPVSVPVSNPDQIATIFDKISYQKGAALIRMMDHFLGRETLKSGLENYLRALQFQAASQDDLWYHLNKAAKKDKRLPKGLNVKQIMDTWTLEPGYPVLDIERDYNNGTAMVTQKRFMFNGPDHLHGSHYWWTPVDFCSPGKDCLEKSSNPLWLSPTPQAQFIHDLPTQDTPIIFNVQQTGYYRVNYDLKNWHLLVKHLNHNHTSIHVLNRAQILDDVFNLARAGFVPYSVTLRFTQYLPQERDHVPWTRASRALQYIGQMFRRTPAYGDYEKFMRTLVRPMYKALETAEKTTMDLDLQQSITSWACFLKIEDCCQKGQVFFAQWMQSEDPDNDNPVPIMFRKTTYCQAVAEGGEEEWNFVWNRYLATTVASERARLLKALACSKEIWILSKFLHSVIEKDSKIRRQDARSVFSLVASNVYGRDLAFDFIREKWTLIKQSVGSNGAERIFKGSVLAGRNTRLELRELRQFFENFKGNLGSSLDSVRQKIESTERNVAWMEANYDNIKLLMQRANEKVEHLFI